MFKKAERKNFTGNEIIDFAQDIYMTDLTMYECECDCDKCRMMCKAPCCGTVEEMQRLIDHGYGDRLMLDTWGGQPDMLKPALKGYEGQNAPWDVSSLEGCTFWKDGKCELHTLKLKPLGGRIATHDREKSIYEKFTDFMDENWEKGGAADILIERWENNLDL